MAQTRIVGLPRLLKNSYQGIEVRPELLAPALNQLKSAMTPSLFELIVKNKSQRDGEDKYHLTVVTPAEFRKLKQEGRFKAPEKPFQVDLVGVGTASNEKSQTWFAVAKSVALDHYRYSMGLPRLDFHVTLGFTNGDVHGVPKNESTLL